MAEISATLISVPAGEVDDRIDDALRILGEYLEVDRAFVYERTRRKRRHRQANRIRLTDQKPLI